MYRLPSVILLHDVPEEVLRSFEIFLGQEGLKDKVKRNGGISFSSEKIDLDPLSSVIDLLRQLQEKVTDKASPSSLKERIRELEDDLKAAKAANETFRRDIDLLKDKLRNMAGYLDVSGVGSDKLLHEVKGLLEIT